MGAWFPSRRLYLLHAWAPHELNLAHRDTSISMPFLEMLAAVYAVYTWREALQGQVLDLQSDCVAAVEAVVSGYSRMTPLHHLVPALLAITNASRILAYASHIPGVQNVEADALSRSASTDPGSERHSLASLFFPLLSVQEASVTRTRWEPLPSRIWPGGSESSLTTPSQRPHTELTPPA